MQITSPLWVLAMFGTVAVYWLLAPRWRSEFLALATAAFLLAVDQRAFLLLALFVVATHFLLQLQRGIATAAALLLPLVALAAYKLQAQGDPLSTLEGAVIPLGLSYTVFRILHYVIEHSRHNLPAHGFRDYLAYVFFLPTILIGPINRFPEFLHGRRAGAWRGEQISGGLERILIGYFKVTVLGNTLLAAAASHWVPAAADASRAAGIYVDAVFDSLTLYILFSGYSDVAIGFALMLGYRVMENFRFPFLQTNIADFWRCWHMSLTSWSREYVFMTALSVLRNPYYATLCSLLFIGVWHELSPRYILWGLYHGAGIVAYMQWRSFRRRARLPAFRSAVGRALAAVGSALLTANYFFFGFILTSEETVTDSLRAMLTVLSLGAL